MDRVRDRGDELLSRWCHYPPGAVLDEIGVMKWVLLAVIVFVRAVALFAALPRTALLGVTDAVQHSLDTFSVAIRRTAGRADELR